MWSLERGGDVPADEEVLEAARRKGKVGSLIKVCLKCVKREEVDGVPDYQDLDCEIWKHLPKDLLFKIFQHLPFTTLIEQGGWSPNSLVDYLITFPPAYKHALLVDKMVFHNLRSSETTERSVELPSNFSSPQALALSSLGILLLVGLSDQSTYRLAWCHLPTSKQFSFIDFPAMPVRLDPRHVYAHVFHPNKLVPASFSVILVVGLRGIHEPRYLPGSPTGSLFIYSSGVWTWSYRQFQTCNISASGCRVDELNTLPKVEIPRPFYSTAPQGLRPSGEPFMFVYFVCKTCRYSSDGLLCCMRLETAKGEWELMPGPSTSMLREIDFHHLHGVNTDYYQTVAVYVDEKTRRLVIGFLKPFEWALSTKIITLDYTRCKKGSVQLVLPWTENLS